MSDTNNAATVQQPAPAPGEGDVWREVIKDACNLLYWCDDHEKHSWQSVMDDMHDRRNFGKKKYGTLLQVENGRNHKIDLLQELLDAAVYAKAECIKEPWNTKLHAVYRDVMRLLKRTKELV